MKKALVDRGRPVETLHATSLTWTDMINNLTSKFSLFKEEKFKQALCGNRLLIETSSSKIMNNGNFQVETLHATSLHHWFIKENSRYVKINIFVLFIILIISPACRQCEQPGNGLIGLASVVQLQPDSTQVFLRDYFPGTEGIEITGLPEGITAGKPGIEDEVWLYGEMPAVYGVLQVKYAGLFYDIPVRKSRKRQVVISYIPKGFSPEKVEVKGSFNGWVSARNPLSPAENAWNANLWLDEGRHFYKIVVDGIEISDPENYDSMSNGMGGYNSVLTVGNPDRVKPQLLTEAIDKRQGIVSIVSDKSLDEVLVFWQNRKIDTRHESGRYVIEIPCAAANFDQSYIRVFAASEGSATNELLIPLLKGTVAEDAAVLPREDYRSMMMYFLMVDRFCNVESDNDKPVNDTIFPSANNMGGDLAGVIKKLNEDYFRDLGMNAVWLSPISRNAEGAWGRFERGGVMTKFSAYHGYWPTSYSQIDSRFGSEKNLKELTDRAHQKGMNLLLDFVANHVHQDHPMLKAHPDWHTSMILPDGTRNLERWDEHRLTTWFDTFLPTLDLERDEVCNAAVDSAMFWVKNFGIDGFRHDATKHIPEKYWRRLSRKIKNEGLNEKRKSFYQVGETYGSAELIGSYLGSGMLDGQFDFNLYDAAVACFASPAEPMTRLGNTLQQSLDYYGHHHLMCNISGNQDKVRFISYADGSVRFDEDTKLAGYTRKIEVRHDSAYGKLAMLHAFNFTIPGIPVVYYGDEIGLPGANDPDNRRMMKFDSLTKPQRKLKSTVSNLAQLRRRSMALNYGSTKILLQNESLLVMERSYFGNSVIIAFNKGVAQDILIDYYAAPKGTLSAFNGNPFTISGNRLSITLPHNSFEIIHTQSISE